MTRYVFSGDGSHKFWEASTRGRELEVRFGRMGTEGQTRSKTLRTPADATAALAKLVAEKTRAGYRPQTKRAAAASALASRLKLTRRERVLVDGDDDGIAELMDSDDAAVLDWRADFDEIVHTFAQFLPRRTIELEESADGTLVTLRTQRAAANVPLTGKPPFGLDVAAALAAILPLAFEAHAFAMSLADDTHSYLIRPAPWWNAFRAQLPRRYRSIFAKPSALPNRFVVIPRDKVPASRTRRAGVGQAR